MVERWYLVEEDFLTELEKTGRIPTPTQSLIITMGSQWYHFREFLNETVPSTERAFRNTPLAYKTKPYQDAMPREDETSSNFLFRNMKKMGGKGKPLQQMADATSRELCDPKEFKHHHFATEIHSGSNVIESVIIEEPSRLREKSTRTRIALELDRWDIGFAVGFTHEGKWFYSASLQSPDHLETYQNLQKELEKIQIVSMSNRRKDKDEARGTEYLIFDS